MPDVVEFDQLAQGSTATSYLLPCRGGGVSIEGATVRYLDERPAREAWLLLGCERSEQIHESFYGERAPQVDICPRKRPGGGGATLAKCCLLETHNEVDADRTVVVPWGASLALIADALGNARPRLGADMGTRLSDSEQYRHLWGTTELASVFEERARLQRWLDILSALAAAQARLDMIPSEAATLIAEHARADLLDLDLVAVETRRTSHSMLGLIRALQQILPESAREYVYVGATVQDITDTWFALVMRDVGAVAWRDLRAIEETLLALAVEHRDTLMAGRTHGQPGSPITFGFKVASWADEVRRHIQRLAEGRPRWLVGQLGGAVGALGFFGPHGLRLRAEFCAELGLADPGISWLTSRDRIAEFGCLLAMICCTLARIGNEVYELQRPEIGELREPTTSDTVGSITMPHKRNPEGSEHLDTLSRLARANAAVLIEGMVVGHERDGRGWKAEWVALPEICLLTGVSLQLARHLLSGLSVEVDTMRSNLHRHGDNLASEQILAGLSQKLGKHTAQQLMHELLAPGSRDLDDVVGAVVASGAATAEEGRAWASRDVGATGGMVDAVATRGWRAHATEPEEWV